MSGCNILITSAGRRSYLVQYFRQALAGAGLVHAGNSSALSPAFVYADATVTTPLIYDEEYIPFLLDYCSKHDIKAIISVFDVDLAVLAAHREHFLEAGVVPVVSTPGVLAVCNDKWRGTSYLQQHGFATPATYLGASAALAAVQSGQLAFPLMVKPRWGMGSIAVYEAADADELRVLARKAERDIAASYLKYESALDPENSVLVQQKLAGIEYGLDVVNDLGCRHKTTWVKRKLAMRAGETDCAVTEDNPALRQLGARLAATLGHVGNLDADVFVDGDDAYILDLNARIGGGYPFSHLAGARLPEAILAWVQGQTPEEACFEIEYGVTGQKDLGIVRLEE